jgi:hypothetical protein
MAHAETTRSACRISPNGSGSARSEPHGSRSRSGDKVSPSADAIPPTRAPPESRRLTPAATDCSSRPDPPLDHPRAPLRGPRRARRQPARADTREDPSGPPASTLTTSPLPLSTQRQASHRSRPPLAPRTTTRSPNRRETPCPLRPAIAVVRARLDNALAGRPQRARVDAGSRRSLLQWSSGATSDVGAYGATPCRPK